MDKWKKFEDRRQCVCNRCITYLAYCISLDSELIHGNGENIYYQETSCTFSTIKDSSLLTVADEKNSNDEQLIVSCSCPGVNRVRDYTNFSTLKNITK